MSLAASRPSAAPAFGAPSLGAHVLIVDDDRRIRSLLTRFLLREGYLVTAAASAAEATEILREIVVDLIVLDVMMPGESGVQFAARLREGPEPLRSAPLLMLTALAETAHRLEGLEAGVDDYLSKPFDPRELSLRIASILRRARRLEPAPDPRVRFGPFLYDPARGELTRAGDAVRLTSRERELLQTLVDHAGAIVARQTLASSTAAERTVDVEIARLRRKIETDPNAPRHLQTVRGQGYRLLVEPPCAARTIS